MKYALFLIASLFMAVNPILAADPPVQALTTAAPQVKSASAILTDASTDQVLYEKGCRVRRPMASTTKVMTAILVIEHCNMDDVVIASKNASLVPFTSLHLKPGEKVKVKDLLTAMLIRSANDTAVALAEHVAGSVPAFAKMMNDKAKEIGAKDTHFVTPNGLHAPGHYTTAYDLAMITRYALRLPEFNEIICTTSKRIDRSINTQDILIQNKSKFLKNYEGADGVKSGYIKQAGHCYVGSATRNGWRLVSVVLNSPESQADTAALMDYGFARYQKVVLARPDEPLEKISVHGGESELDVVPEREVHVAVLPGQESLAKIDKQIDDVHAPVKKGDKVGTISAYVGDRKVTTIDLRAAEDVGESTASIAWPWVRTIGFLAMLSIGVACGRTAAKSVGNGRSRLS